MGCRAHVMRAPLGLRRGRCTRAARLNTVRRSASRAARGGDAGGRALRRGAGGGWVGSGRRRGGERLSCRRGGAPRGRCIRTSIHIVSWSWISGHGGLAACE
eukprot:3975005-Prymnesium_polylepis.1